MVSEAEKGNRITDRSDAGSVTHAGGVVYKLQQGHVLYLLVQSSASKDEWVLPKGHIEADETKQQAAVREVREESGCWAKILSELEEVCYEVDSETIRCRFYLMCLVKEESPGKYEAARAPRWLPLNEAIAEASFEQTKYILAVADRARKLLEKDQS